MNGTIAPIFERLPMASNSKSAATIVIAVGLCAFPFSAAHSQFHIDPVRPDIAPSMPVVPDIPQLPDFTPSMPDFPQSPDITPSTPITPNTPVPDSTNSGSGGSTDSAPSANDDAERAQSTQVTNSLANARQQDFSSLPVMAKARRVAP
jgi:hypothetical protein